MKILLIGNWRDNTGPCNVNKALIENSNGSLNYIKTKNKYLKSIEIIYKILTSNVIIYSGSTYYFRLYHLISKILNKKEIYILHSYREFDNNINRLNLSPKKILLERYILNNVNAIICVSEKFKGWFERTYKGPTAPIFFVNNGIELCEYKNDSIDKKNIIALSGGNRNIKNNKFICDLVDQINKEMNTNIVVYIFGSIHSNNEEIKSKCARLIGQLEKSEYYEKLSQCKLFICDSIVESFNLSVVDAINCKCNLLLNVNVGITSLLNLNDNEIINEYLNKEEIKRKIIFGINNSQPRNYIINNYSWNDAFNKLYSICLDIYKNNIQEGNDKN